MKWFKIITLIVIANLQLINDSNAGRRFTTAAHLSDNLQCASLWAVYTSTQTATYALCPVGILGYYGCFTASTIAAMAALVGVHQEYAAWAFDVASNTKVVNTTDMGKPQCAVSGGGDLKQNLNDGTGIDLNQRWRETGILSNYCYAEEFNHQLKDNPSNPNIYNDGRGKIGLSYKGNDPVWISPGDCKAIETSAFMSFIAPTRQFCAWQEGDEICAEAVFCTGLVIGEVIPIHAYAGDATNTPSEARRECGDDPYTTDKNASQDRIDDFNNNNRCECFCCTGSDGEGYGDVCNQLSQHRVCKTYNEKYRAHCIKSPIIEEDYLPPAEPQRTVSAHCRMDVKSGNPNFSFLGKSVRCLTKTIENMYFGKEDIMLKDSDGNFLLDLNGSPRFNTQCIDDAVDPDGSCTKSFYRNIQSNFANIIGITLMLWMVFLSVRFVMVGEMGKADFMKYILQLSVVLYFVTGSGWRDGYFNFLMYGGYELSEDYIKSTVETSDEEVLSSINSVVNFDSLGEEQKETVARCSFIDVPIATQSAWEEMQECNFFDNARSSYSDNERYYSVLDSVDCRFSKYVGFDQNNYYPQIIKLAVHILFNSPAGIVFFASAIVFLICCLLLLLKIVMMLISVAVMISFLIYVSPVIIPLMLFEKTKKIFDKWLGLLLGYSLQPFLILALVSLMILLLDGFFITFLKDLYQIGGFEYREAGLGISAPTINNLGERYDVAMLISNMIKFLFLLVVIMSVFDKFGSILNSLSNAADVGSFIKPPDFKGNMKKGAKKAGGAAAIGAKAAANKVRSKISR